MEKQSENHFYSACLSSARHTHPHYEDEPGRQPPFTRPPSCHPLGQKGRPHLLPPARHPVVVRLVALGGELVLLHDLECPQDGERVTSEPQWHPQSRGASAPPVPMPPSSGGPGGHQIMGSPRRVLRTPLSTGFLPGGGVAAPRGRPRAALSY